MRSATLNRLAFLLVCGLLARWVYLLATPLGAKPERASELRGVYHVHTTHSDGSGSVEEVALAAAADGLDFVVITDHNVAPLPAELRHGVLIVYGEEESVEAGHRVLLSGDHGNYVFWAHPLNRRVPWTDWSARSDGLEILSADDMWRDALQPPWTSLLTALLDYPVAPLEATYQLFRRPAATLDRYDQQVAAGAKSGLRPAALCSVDAHGLPPYRTVFAALQLHLPGLRFTADPPRDARRLADALAQGRFYCGLDGFRDASGLTFERDAKGVHLSMPTVGSEARAELTCDGRAVGEFALPAVVPDLPGCRLEIRLADLSRRFPASGGGWIYTGVW